MDDFKRFPKTQSRQLIDYNRFLDLTGEKVFICLDRGVMEIMRYLLNTRGSWRSTYVKEYVGTVGYMMPTEEEFNAVQDAIGEANIDMSACSDIVDALSGIKDAIDNLAFQASSSSCGCGGGSGGSGTNEAEPNPWENGGDPDAYPPGFSSSSQFSNHKCRAAAKIVRDIISDLQSISVISITGLTLTAIGGLILAVLATPVPFDDILVIAGVLLFSVLASSYIATLSSELNDIYDELVCALLNGEDATESRAGIITVIQDVIADMGLSSPEESALNTIADSVVTYDAINRMYEPGEQYEIDYTCDCGEPETVEYTVLKGTELTSHPSNPFVVVGEFDSAGGLCGPNGRIVRFTFGAPVTITEITGNSPSGFCGACGGIDIFNYYSVDDFTVLITSTNSRPQDLAPVSGVRAMNIYQNCDGEDPEMTIYYMVE